MAFIYKLAFVLLLLLTFYIINHQCKKTSKTSLKSTTKKEKSRQIGIEDDPFLELTDYLLRTAASVTKSSKSPKLKAYSIKDYPKRRVHRILKQLSQSQTAIKSLDGATHSLGNTLADK
jgi:hypothetical protein